ncbi:MAG: hypothetical protein NVS1B3_10090 [Candidatus Dormibacteraceae bacterium]
MAVTSAPRRSRGQRFAWIYFVVVSAVVFLFGLTDLMAGGSTFGGGEGATFVRMTGITWQSIKGSPVASQIDWMVRAQAIWMMIAGVLSAFIAATAFRRGERWAWFAMAVWPIGTAVLDLNLLFSIKHPGGGVPPPLVSGAISIILALAALALTYRTAFRRQ